MDGRLLRTPAADDRGHHRFPRAGGTLPHGGTAGGFRRRPRAAWLSPGQADADQSGRRGECTVIVIPAIDLKDGRCVRLRQGRMQEETVYSPEPADVARRWEDEGAQLLHVVDLNGAVEGPPRNRKAIEPIIKAVSIPVQVGGGIRAGETVTGDLSSGVERGVLATAAGGDRAVPDEACGRFRGRVLVGVGPQGGTEAVTG